MMDTLAKPVIIDNSRNLIPEYGQGPEQCEVDP